MTHNLDQDRRAAGGFLAGAAVCVALAAGTGSTGPVWFAAGMLISSLMYFRRTMPRRPYSYWPAWATGTVVALLLAWAQPGAQRLALLPLAGAEVTVALVLALLWFRRRTGRGDWIVWLPEEGVLLRREWSRRDAIRWAEDDYRKPCAISPLDDFPDMAHETPLYPERDRPFYRPPRLGDQT